MYLQYEKKLSSLLLFVFFVNVLFPVFAKPVINERKWIISGAGRTIYLLKLDGTVREILFDKVGDEDARIEVLTNSYNGKIILCKVISKTRFSYWLIDLDRNEQYPIIEDLKVRPSNSIMSRDGSKVSFTTSEQAGMKIWYYDVLTKQLSEFGENVNDGQVRFVRFSYDGKYALYSKLKGTIRDRYTIMCLRDLSNQKDKELTTRSEGEFDFGEFYFDNQNILVSRIVEGDDYNTLWDYNIKTKRFTFVMEITEEYISAVSMSRDGNQIAICTYNPKKPNRNYFYTMKKDGPYNLTYINDINSGMIGIRLSDDGRFLIYSTENSPTYLASFDGSFNERLADLVELPNLKDSMWYIHPPFPPVVNAIALEESNLVSWKTAETGSHPIAGYKIYRSTFPEKKNFTYLTSTTELETEYRDTTADPKENYYYLVRSFDTDLTESIPSNHVLLDRTPPSIKITNPKTGLLTNLVSIKIIGNAFDHESGIKELKMNEKPFHLDADGQFEIPYLLKEGINLFSVVAYDQSGNKAEDSIDITLDSIAPLIQIDFPQNNTELIASLTNIRGAIIENGSGLREFSLNNIPLTIADDGSFFFPITIEPGVNILNFKATDQAGNQSNKMVQVKGIKKITVLLTIGSYEIVVNGLPGLIDAPPFIDEKSKRTLVPARFVVEPIGGNIVFEEATQKITILRETDKIELWIGQNLAIVNGKEKKIDPDNDFITPRIENGRTFLPLRFVAESIGFLVEWDPVLHQIKLFFPKIS